MVEKVFISPNRVRAYGNIINMKTGDDFTLVNSELTVTTDTVNGAEMTVFQFEVEGGISIALTSSASTCNVGDNVLLTATVMDRSTPVEAAEVTFKVGETVLGTDETDANGVATYTYATSSAGSLSFSASYQTSTSNSVSVTVNHSYSLAFSQATYTASGGSATLECTLLEDNVAKSGASVTVTGSDGSVYNGITNSQGIASVTVSNISTTITFTASYSNVTDACTVNPAIYIINDDASVDNSSTLFGSYISLRNSGTNSVSYTSSTPCYVLKNTKRSSESLRPYSALNGYTNSFKLTVRSKCTSSSACPISLYYYLDSNNWGGVKDEHTNLWVSSKTNGSFTESNKGGTNHLTSELTDEFIYNSTSNTLTINRYYNGAIEHTQVMNIPVTLNSNVKWGTTLSWDNNATCEVYEIIAEPI